MANRYILFFLFTLGFIQSGFCQHYTIKGRVVDNKNKSPMEFVTVYLPGYELWAITNEKGQSYYQSSTSRQSKNHCTIFGIRYADIGYRCTEKHRRPTNHTTGKQSDAK